MDNILAYGIGGGLLLALAVYTVVLWAVVVLLLKEVFSKKK